MRYLLFALLLWPGIAFAQQPPPQAVRDLAVVQITLEHLMTGLNQLVQENNELKAKVKDLEAKKDANKP